MTAPEFSPSDIDAGTEARFRRDEIHGLIDFGVPVEAIHSHASASSPDNTEVEETIQIYGECTAYVSANDIERLRTNLSPEDFAKVCDKLGWTAAAEGYDDAA